MRLALARAVSLLLVLAALLPLPAQAQSVNLIRDAEIEQMILDFAAPLLRAAGISRTPRVHLIADRRFNAFVTEDGGIYIHHGAIIEARTPAALKAVLAHEIGHLAGGHIARIREQSEIAGRVMAISTLLGIGAVAASAGMGGDTSQMGEVASAFILASQSAAANSVMSFQRGEESAADAAALQYLRAAGQTPKGLVDTLTMFSENEVARSGASPYLRSHPLADDRLAQVEQAARASPHWGKEDSAADVQRLAMARAKLVGFLDGLSATLNYFPNGDSSLPARYARTIAAYKAGAGAGAIPQMTSLVAMAPSNPYLNELLGQMYYETGQPRQAIGPLRRAVELAPNATEIRILYGQALIDAGGANVEEAVAQLARASREDPRSVRAFTLLSRAYGVLGREGDAMLAAAEAAVVRGDLGTALGLARRAQQMLTQGSPAWIRAQDILALG